MNPHDEDVVAPSLDFGSEAEVVDDWSYVEKCRAMADKLVVGLNCRLGESLLTKEENWGLVWRSDFTGPDHDFSPLINRIVCWQTPGEDVTIQIAIAQRLRPLGDPSKSYCVLMS